MGMCRLPHVVEKHARQERRGGVADRHNDLVQRLHLRDFVRTCCRIRRAFGRARSAPQHLPAALMRPVRKSHGVQGRRCLVRLARAVRCEEELGGTNVRPVPAESAACIASALLAGTGPTAAGLPMGPPETSVLGCYRRGKEEDEPRGQQREKPPGGRHPEVPRVPCEYRTGWKTSAGGRPTIRVPEARARRCSARSTRGCRATVQPVEPIANTHDVQHAEVGIPTDFEAGRSDRCTT